MKAIILCAGKGERLRPLTENIPKPMVQINNKPVLEYLILLCKKHNITEIAINTSYLPEKIKEYFGNGEKFGVKLRYSFEPELLGTSGALNNFRDFLKDEPFFVLYGDQVTDIDLTKLMKYHKEKKGILTTAVRKKPISKPPGSLIFTNENLKLRKIIEKPSNELFKELCKEFYLSNSGLYVCEPEILKFIPEGFSDFAKDIFSKLIKQEKNLFVFMMDGYYFREIGKIEKYELAKNELESGKFKLSFLINNKIQKAIFLDRDGTINENIYETDGRLMSPANVEQIKILDYAKQGIDEMKKLGFKIIIITNQPGLAFGYIDSVKFKEMNEYFKKELGVDETYHCPHHPSRGKVQEFIKVCGCRKPHPTLIQEAAKDFNIDINKSYMVGDSLSDVKTGQNAGVKKTFLLGILRKDIMEIQHQKGIFPDYTCRDLFEVAEKIKELEKQD